MRTYCVSGRDLDPMETVPHLENPGLNERHRRVCLGSTYFPKPKATIID